MTNPSDVAEETVLSGDQAFDLMRELSTWGRLRTIIIHGGSVFEFDGAFPRGEMGSGYYNLQSAQQGFEGHINLDKVDHIAFQDALHRGRQAYAFIFKDANGDNIFKVFIGRDENGDLLTHQVERFKQIRSNLDVKV